VSTDYILLTLRIISGLILIAILAALFFIIWRDYRSATLQAQASRRTYGKLTPLMQVHESYLPRGESYPLLPLTSLGRAPTNHIVIDEQTASSEHAVVALRNGQWWLEDRNSRNGTLLNGELIHTAVIIANGDIISIGSASFQIELE